VPHSLVNRRVESPTAQRRSPRDQSFLLSLVRGADGLGRLWNDDDCEWDPPRKGVEGQKTK
jgi:hypothetical protein